MSPLQTKAILSKMKVLPKRRRHQKKEKLEQEIPTAQISENSPEDESPPKKKKKSKKGKQHQAPEAGTISDSSAGFHFGHSKKNSRRIKLKTQGGN